MPVGISCDRLFQSRRSGFGVCVPFMLNPPSNTFCVSVPAIGIWGLRRQQTLRQNAGLNLFQSRRSGFGVCVLLGLPREGKPLRFQSRRSGFGVCVTGRNRLAYLDNPKFQSRRSGFGVCVAVNHFPGRIFFQKFQSRRSGFGVCVFSSD